MATTHHMNIALVEQGQAQKEVTVNEALVQLDALMNVGVVDKDLATPPVSPANGDVYIIASGATDEWLGQDNRITYFDQIWRFISPSEGVMLWVNDEDILYVFDGSAWVIAAVSPNQNINNVPQIGVNTVADITNRLSVRSPAALFTAETNDMQVKVNKTAIGDTASYLFQTNFSGRAEFGLVGDDHFQLKVSPDGSVFLQSFTVDNATGNIDFKQDVSVVGELTARRRSNTIVSSATLALIDANTWHYCNSASAIVITVPANSSVGFQVGTEVVLARGGVGAVSIAAAVGVTIYSHNSLLNIANQYQEVRLKKVGTDEWILVGDLA